MASLKSCALSKAKRLRKAGARSHNDGPESVIGTYSLCRSRNPRSCPKRTATVAISKRNETFMVYESLENKRRERTVIFLFKLPFSLHKHLEEKTKISPKK